MLKLVSLLGLLVMIIALVGLYLTGSLFSLQPIAITLQALAVALMIWARLAFGRRSFHGLGVLLFLGGLARLLCEERLVKQTYPEYGDYAKTTKRMIPFVF